ncbi:MAG TPA: DUF1800 domain-containing protein [Sphingobium sp.]
MTVAQIAFNRFGLGRRPYDPEPGDAKAWLTGQFANYQPALPGAASLAGPAEIARDLGDTIQRIAAGSIGGEQGGEALRRPGQGGGLLARRRPPAPAMQPDQAMQAAPEAMDPKKQARAEVRAFSRDQHIAQVSLRIHNAVATDTPFVERLVHFWSNHFAVSADKLQTIAFSGLMEFDAIRPHVLGRFEDMLVAVERHPAMLLYLDQAQSVGPNSTLGSRAAGAGRKVGLNENLGREILELHTLGVRSGYTQGDVTEFARALTGWTVAGIGRGRIAERLQQGGKPGEFFFAPPLHEPGARTILGKSYAQAGEAQAGAVLGDLARHPATARHIATKLARHFVADEPPPALVARLETAFLKSDGDLPTVYRALVEAPEAWNAEPAKFRTPWQWGVALLRGVSVDRAKPVAQVNDRILAGLFQELGQPVWRPGSPAGFDDVAASWAAPDALYRRVELAGRVAQQARADTDARALAERLFGAGLSAETKRAIAQADSPQQGLALLLVAPEMMRV